VSTVPTSWWKAEMQCFEYGGDMLTVEKEIELGKLETLLKSG
jgi:hypothetical protein